jgi:hypothetical protein
LLLGPFLFVALRLFESNAHLFIVLVLFAVGMLDRLFSSQSCRLHQFLDIMEHPNNDTVGNYEGDPGILLCSVHRLDKKEHEEDKGRQCDHYEGVKRYQRDREERMRTPCSTRFGNYPSRQIRLPGTPVLQTAVQ